jgi:predicted transcriptional regulator
MATQNNVHVSEELLAELQAKAQAEGKTVDELAEEALRKSLEERAWQDLLAYGLETGRESGYSEADVPDIVKNRRRTNAIQGR